MIASSYLIGFILVATLATILTRALPFLLLQRAGEHPFLVYLGRYLPPMMMALLVVYASSGLPLGDGRWVPSIGALLVVALVQWKFKNALLSILIGWGVYLYLN